MPSSSCNINMIIYISIWRFTLFNRWMIMIKTPLKGTVESWEIITQEHLTELLQYNQEHLTTYMLSGLVFSWVPLAGYWPARWEWLCHSMWIIMSSRLQWVTVVANFLQVLYDLKSLPSLKTSWHQFCRTKNFTSKFLMQ